MNISRDCDHSKQKIVALTEKGVKIPNPESVYIGPEVDVSNISGTGVALYAGSKITGNKTFIHHHATIGYEGPVTIENCQIGANVHLNSGFFRESVFLDNVTMGYGSHVREGCICEENSSIAHTVGLKQTILFPFVTLGSLINFCDCLMAGGTGKDNHSEVGSSYIHFNFTPNQDKATPSLIGDVPKGVMLKERPIFLGGQGGLVGPCRLAYGTIVAAGTILRKDELRPNRLIFGGNPNTGNMPLGEKIHQNVKKILTHNINYIANLIALKRYYIDIRSLFVGDTFPEALLKGLIEKADMGINERIKRLATFRSKLLRDNESSGIADDMADLGFDMTFYTIWPEIEKMLDDLKKQAFTCSALKEFIKTIQAKIQVHGKNYLGVISGLTSEEANTGTRWLETVVGQINHDIFKRLPSNGMSK
ncbi:MAG: protein GlmU [Proteobacteria bacterium]|nr:protein GlmU [Pseudomonadota bacterium]